MTTAVDTTQLLRQLGPAASPAAAARSTPLTGEGAFAELLRKAQAGELSSARPVTLSSDASKAGVQLNSEQLAVLSAAADQAETAGVRTALVLIGGQMLKLDVGNRTIVGPAEQSGGVLAGFDGVINLSDQPLSGPTGGRSAPQGPGFPSWSLTTPGLAEALQGRDTKLRRSA